MQMAHFKKAEQSFWKKLGQMHNKLVEVGLIDNEGLFVDPENMDVQVTYAETPILQTREDKIRELTMERDAGFTSIKRAIAALNPDQQPGFVEELMAEIKAERTVVINGNETSENNGEDSDEIQSSSEAGDSSRDNRQDSRED